MKRTHTRPLPSGKISVMEATSWGVFSGVAGVGTLYAFTNPVVAALGASNIALYAGPYTFLKQHSEVNTWVGSVVGAIPPVMGWAAASGGVILAPDCIALATLLYLWQFPHFFALSWMYKEDYSRGNFQMVSVNDPTGSRTANLITRYSAYLTVLPVATYLTDVTSIMFPIEATAANMYLLYTARKFQEDTSNANARKIFLCSLWYLPLLMTAFVFHSQTWSSKQAQQQDYSLLTTAKNWARDNCVHEMLVQKTNHEKSSLCPVKVADKVIEDAEEEIGQKVQTVSSTLQQSTSEQH
eukprot:CAMPEP_0185031728 /NCGR_PEP_ID=MMETSP1103-20130426/19355_1 /TAXON_ID=36769 /ORGANISM="Paraphysomonas bandaiensis, Strain Caron Lab Isolate" /LENGTH=296 /DNA_ID=CAMNT_0027567349 /DNA_START=364 /DNA_END=1254 /DNA_ORIENTATION=+